MKAVPLSNQQHANLKVQPARTYTFSKNLYIASLQVNEFTRAASTYPIVFVRNNGGFHPFALLGLKRGENLFVDEAGRWKTGYIPAVIRSHPFILGKAENRDEMMICIDMESELVSEEEGQPLFDGEGKPTEIVENARKTLSEFQRFVEFTRRFSNDLNVKGLLSPLEIKIRETGGGQQSVDGCYGVSEKKLNELPDDEFLALRKSGMLPLIYAQTLSMGQMERLLRLQREQQGEKLAEV